MTIHDNLNEQIKSLISDLRSNDAYSLDKDDYELIDEIKESDNYDDQLLNQLLGELSIENLDELEPNLRINPTRKINQSSSFGLSVLSNAQKDLSEGVYEDLGRNDGKRIREYFKYFNSPAKQEWCAAAVSAWMIEAGGGPVQGSLGAREIGRQFESAGKWIPKNKIKPEDLALGNIAVWSRGEAGSGKGHIGVISSSDDYGNFSSIEGNSGPQGDRVYENRHSMNDSNLLGIGISSNDESFEDENMIISKSKISIDLIYKVAKNYENLCKFFV
jgi:hypothetical protein